MNKNPQRWLVGLVILVVVVAGGRVLWSVSQRQSSARKNWKEEAISEIARFANDSKWVADEMALLCLGQGAKNQRIIADRWLTDRMVLMASGEWLIYKSHCNKVPPHHIRDIFLAKGSNGRWYYSTHHFCVRMSGLLIHQGNLPYDLATFVQDYRLKEFDGVSDESLELTHRSPITNVIPKTYSAPTPPGRPDLSVLGLAADGAIRVATNSDPDLRGHGLELCGLRYEHRFPSSDRPARTTYTAIYRNSTLHGGSATGIEIELRENVAYFKSQKGQPLWSCPVDRAPSVPDDLCVRIAFDAFWSFWPKIDTNRLALDQIVCSAQGEGYSISFRLASPCADKPSTTEYARVEVEVSANGTVAESEVRWTSP